MGPFKEPSSGRAEEEPISLLRGPSPRARPPKVNFIFNLLNIFLTLSYFAWITTKRTAPFLHISTWSDWRSDSLQQPLVSSGPWAASHPHKTRPFRIEGDPQTKTLPLINQNTKTNNHQSLSDQRTHSLILSKDTSSRTNIRKHVHPSRITTTDYSPPPSLYLKSRNCRHVAKTYRHHPSNVLHTKETSLQPKNPKMKQEIVTSTLTTISQNE